MTGTPKRGRPYEYTPAIADEVMRLARAHVSYRDIADRLGITHPMVQRIINRMTTRAGAAPHG